eukprot:CAMPEP_0198251272 /NCGR_PEP_ID=MMETSP1447-20131203/2153_1 /TAXON_ID=420782 /ORGANISM="Chaetoceros dichaeta, Strain CCMP1751" /LENGTH=646 /DNA_ID=CAMNT_0043936249 /DNA_START=181 /DNA_END=2121 /DNA_ORIENTATION=-
MKDASGSNATPTKSSSSEQWDSILTGDFVKHCGKAFLERDHGEDAIEIDETDTKIEVLSTNDIVNQDKYGRFLKSAEYQIFSQYKDLYEWYRTHEFNYDKQSLFEIFMMGELPVAVQPTPYSAIASASASAIAKAAVSTIAAASAANELDVSIHSTKPNDEWTCDEFEKYLINTSGDNEFPCKFSHKDHREYPFIKDTSITEHLNSGALEGMPPIRTRLIQVDMQGYDYIIERINDKDIGTMTASKLVSTGTVERIVCDLDGTKQKLIGKTTPALLTNVYVINTTIQSDQDHILTSIRYGTPVRKEAGYLHCAQRHKDLIKFAQQIRPRKSPDQPNRVCVLSFLDHCNHDVSFGHDTAVKKKGHEDEILRVELDAMHDKKYVYVQQMSASAGLTFKVSRGTETMSFRELLGMWCEGVGSADTLLRHVHEKHGCFDSSYDPKLRFKEFIAISMIQFILQMDSAFNFILCYHCMSGKDRTGMFFGINETVHHFCAGLKNTLEEDAINRRDSISLKCNITSSKRKSIRTSFRKKRTIDDQAKREKAWMQLFDDLCKFKPSWFENELHGDSLGHVLDKFVRRSILITGASTGWFGLKFGIGITYDFKRQSLLKGVKKSIGNYLGANPVAILLAPFNRIMDWQLDSQQADS